MRHRKLAAALGLLMLWPGAMTVAGVPDKVPDAKALARAEKVIKNLFQADYARSRPSDRLNLSRKLFQQGLETNDDPAARYVLFREAINLAAQGGSLTDGLNAIEELASSFTVVAPALKVEFLEKLSPHVKTAFGNRELAQEALQAVREAIRLDAFDVVDRALKVAGGAAQKAQSVSLLSRVRTQVNEMSSLRQEYQRVQAALVILDKNPHDAEANLTAGKYYSFRKANWDKGLPLLARGADPKLKSLAAKDLAMPADAAGQMEVGDGWYDLATSQNVPARVQLQIHAYHWYEQAAPGLTGLSKAKVEKRLTELEKVVNAHVDRGELFALIRRAIRLKKIQETQAVGGAFAKQWFQEVPPEGALLIGFDIGLGKFFQNDVVYYLRPIFLTSFGEKKGTPYGRPTPKVITVKAKEGYAVGALTIRGGGGLDAVSVTFMKIGEDRLNKDVSYKTQRYGGPGGGEGTVGGDGSPVIGICGRRSDNGAVGGLGVVILQNRPELPNSKKPLKRGGP